MSEFCCNSNRPISWLGWCSSTKKSPIKCSVWSQNSKEALSKRKYLLVFAVVTCRTNLILLSNPLQISRPLDWNVEKLFLLMAASYVTSFWDWFNSKLIMCWHVNWWRETISYSSVWLHKIHTHTHSEVLLGNGDFSLSDKSKVFHTCGNYNHEH